MTINPYSDNILAWSVSYYVGQSSTVINYVLWDCGSIKLILVVCIVQIISYIWLWAQISWTSVLEEERMVTKQGKSKREWQSAGVLCATRRASKTASSCRRKQSAAKAKRKGEGDFTRKQLHYGRTRNWRRRNTLHCKRIEEATKEAEKIAATEA